MRIQTHTNDKGMHVVKVTVESLAEDLEITDWLKENLKDYWVSSVWSYSFGIVTVTILKDEDYTLFVLRWL